MASCPSASAPGSALLAQVLGGGAKVVLVDSMDLVAPDRAAQAAAQTPFKRGGIELMPVSAKDWAAAKVRVLVQSKRVVFGEVVDSVLDVNAAFEKHGKLARLRVGRDRRSAELGDAWKGIRHGIGSPLRWSRPLGSSTGPAGSNGAVNVVRRHFL